MHANAAHNKAVKHKIGVNLKAALYSYSNIFEDAALYDTLSFSLFYLKVLILNNFKRKWKIL